MNETASVGKKAKILILLKILYTKTDNENGLTIEEIKEELAGEGIDAERKSIYSDIDTLNSLNFGIEKRRVKGVTSYHLTGRLFTLSQLKLLVDAVITSKFITKKQSEELTKKLESLASNKEANELKREIYIDDRPKTVNEEVFRNLDIIVEARNKGRRIDFEYWEWNKDKVLEKRKSGGDRKNVSPCFLEFYNGYYYMVALNEEGSVRYFRVDKMRKITVNELRIDSKVGSNEFRNPARYSAKTIGMYDGEDCKVCLEVPEEKVGILLDYFGTSSVYIRKSRAYDNRLRCDVEIKLSNQFYGWLLGVSEVVRLAEPKEAVDEYGMVLEKNLKMIRGEK